jgi:hypothetical protein
MMMPMNGTRRRRSGRFGLGSLALATIVGGLAWGTALSAGAAVPGKRGLEIEGARDRRGFYFGGGMGFGGTFFWYDDFLPAMRVDLALGGGVTKRFTLGANVHVTPYLSRRGGVAFGGDIEATGFVFRGLYLRGALGAAGVPRRDSEDPDRKGLTAGLGGAAGIGYEFFLNSTAAMSAGFTYDARFVPGSRFPRQTLLVGLRFTFY